jgi:hypothetical protein
MSVLRNVEFREGAAVALLDWEFAAPGGPVYDLAQMARMGIPMTMITAPQGWAGCPLTVLPKRVWSAIPTGCGRPTAVSSSSNSTRPSNAKWIIALHLQRECVAYGVSERNSSDRRRSSRCLVSTGRFDSAQLDLMTRLSNPSVNEALATILQMATAGELF